MYNTRSLVRAQSSPKVWVPAAELLPKSGAKVGGYAAKPERPVGLVEACQLAWLGKSGRATMRLLGRTAHVEGQAPTEKGWCNARKDGTGMARREPAEPARLGDLTGRSADAHDTHDLSPRVWNLARREARKGTLSEDGLNQCAVPPPSCLTVKFIYKKHKPSAHSLTPLSASFPWDLWVSACVCVSTGLRASTVYTALWIIIVSVFPCKYQSYYTFQWQNHDASMLTNKS